MLFSILFCVLVGYTIRQGVSLLMYEDYIPQRIVQLRLQRGVSARDMSLSLGQNASYINRIENHKALPSLSGLLYICDYFDITPKQFFDEDQVAPGKINELLQAAAGLRDEQIDAVIAILQYFQR